MWPVDGARNWTATVGGLPGIVSSSWIVKNVAVELDVVVPAGIPVGNATLVVSHLGVASNAFPVTIVAVDPVLDFGAYTAFAHLTGVSITPTAPAAPGETVTTFMTGLGATNPVVAIGTAVNAFIPTAQTTTVTVAGEAAPVRFAGFYPGGTAGTDQVSFDLPSDIASGTQPVVVSIGGVTSNTEILFVGTQVLPLGQPVVSAVVNGASFGNQSTISPGSFISIFSSGLSGPDNASAFPNTTVNGVSVEVNGKSAPIFGLFASIGQINALVPTDADIGASLQIVVQNRNGPSKPGAYFGGAAGPGIFLVPDPSSNARTNAAATLANSAWLVIPATQAKALGLPACTGLSANCQALKAGCEAQENAVARGPMQSLLRILRWRLRPEPICSSKVGVTFVSIRGSCSAAEGGVTSDPITGRSNGLQIPHGLSPSSRALAHDLICL